MRWALCAKRALLAGSAFLVGAAGGDRPAALRRLLAIEPLEPRTPLSAAGLVEVGRQPEGGLSHKIAYIHAGHGYTAANESNGAWSFQRGPALGMIEDLGNIDQMNFLADYLFRAGATVVPLRPIGHQTNQVVLDNDDAGVSFVGNWSNSSATVFYGSAGDVPYKFVSTSPTETAYARYQPTIPQEGFYPVYAWTRAGSDRATDQIYRVKHSGGITEVTVNHRRVGNGLVYLGTYYFEAGTSGYVDISNRSDSPGSVVIADMIRFGNGMGDIDRGGGISGLPREDEAGLYWVQWHVDRSQGIPSSEYRALSVDRDATVSLSPRYAEYMNREADGTLSDRVFVSFHSNASGGRGVLGLYNGNNVPSTATPNQFLLANTLGLEVNNDMVAQNGLYEHDWFNRGTNVTLDRSDIEFGEINNTYINNEFDATIVEVAFHDNQLDAELMRDPKARDAIARATYQGMVKYFRAVDGNTTPLTMLPAAVSGVHAETGAAGSLTISWIPPAANSYLGDAATGYRIYASANGYGFDGGTFIAGGATTSATLSGYDPATPYYFKVVAVNAGGESPGSEVMTVTPSGGPKQVLVVNGFDRLDRALNPKQPPYQGVAVDRVRPRESNSRDYVVQVASAIHAASPGVHVDSTSNEAVISGAVNLTAYHTVIWILGEESTADDTFNATEQTKVEQFIAGGGNLFLSGAEIAWDLDQQNNGRSFFETTLKGNYVADDANSYNVSAPPGGIFAGLPNFSFDNGAHFYDTEFPDVIAPQPGAQIALNYVIPTVGGAAIQVPGTGGRGSIVMFGFPFETISTAANRAAVIDRVLDFFGVTPVPAPRPNYRPPQRLPFRPEPPAFETAQLSAAGGGASVPMQPVGPLTGKIVYTSAGHGWQWNTGLGRYATDRPDYNEIVEDFGNQDQMTFFAEYILRAGGTVVPMRPVGHQTNEVVLDNDSPGVTYSGTWNNSASAVHYDEDYGAVADTVGYRFASTSAMETATATYTPNIPQAGFYPVYTWVLDGSNRTNQLYRINAGGGVTEIRVDHRLVGKGWVYLGTYYFDAGMSGNVQISNQSTPGAVVIADAIRFGNGIGDYPDGPTPSGYPREDENSLLWLRRAIGQGNTASTVIGTSNVSAPSRMAEHMNAAPFGTSVYIGFHSNGTTGDPATATARGAVGLIDTDVADRTPHQAELALYVGRQINQDMQALNGVFEHNWSTRTTHTFTGQFGEIDEGAAAEMDMTIVEVAFHDNTQDSQLLRDPKVRDQIARSTYEAVLEYFDNFGGLDAPVSQPSAPTNIRAVSNANGDISVSWQAGPTGVRGGTPTGYRVYLSRNGYGFYDFVEVSGAATTSHTFSAAALDGDAYYFKVVAFNAGGESPRSAVAGARKNGLGGSAPLLVVDGFDRFDRSQNVRYPYAFTGDGLVDRVWPRSNNSFDYIAQAGEAIEAYVPAVGGGLGFDFVQNEAVINGLVDLANYRAVVWLSGEESTADDTFNVTEQTLVTSYLDGGGKLFVSGAEIGWDLEAQGGGAFFYNNTLRADYVADDANSYNASGVAGTIFQGVSLTFDNGTQFYNVDAPDRIAAIGGSVVAMNYTAPGSGGAAIQYADPTNGSRIVYLAFPFETITTAANRATVMDRVFDFFGLDVPPANADFNNDGLVDAADYVLWRKNDGTSVPPGTSGDADFNGQVNNDDYAIWRAQFGTTPGAGSAVIATLVASPPAGEPSLQGISVEFFAIIDLPSAAADRHGFAPWEFATAHLQDDNWAALLLILAEDHAQDSVNESEPGAPPHRGMLELGTDEGRPEDSRLGSTFFVFGPAI